jgi:polar amino acid transport system permease protein
MSCAETFSNYGFRALGYGERLLPRADITFCEQVFLIGGGMIWNVYFAIVALAAGFFFATALAYMRVHSGPFLRSPADLFVFIFRGSPLFIQFFFAYELFVQIPRVGVDIPLGFMTITLETSALTKAWLGAAIVLFLNTSAYSAEIFTGALRAIPRGDIEAADAFGMGRFTKFKRIIFPTMLRLAWSSYSNEAIFLFHSTALIFFSGFPAWRQEGDGLYYASYFAEKTFNPFIPYPIIAVYFICGTLLIVGFFGLISKRLNRHLPEQPRIKFSLSTMLMR